MEENDKIIFFCENCKVFLKAAKDMAGREDKCPNCGEKVVVPSGNDAGSADDRKK